ncbi:hypothetical protein [Halomonas sp. NCCP-2165]|nr:hypothetical protein [Halomonas sp. NCCP-2165]GKW49929.1 hypothetical protein NCCP2165_21440 [Halomonas sp. NCCP-2165]
MIAGLTLVLWRKIDKYAASCMMDPAALAGESAQAAKIMGEVGTKKQARLPPEWFLL